MSPHLAARCGPCSRVRPLQLGAALAVGCGLRRRVRPLKPCAALAAGCGPCSRAHIYLTPKGGCGCMSYLLLIHVQFRYMLHYVHCVEKWGASWSGVLIWQRRYLAVLLLGDVVIWTTRAGSTRAVSTRAASTRAWSWVDKGWAHQGWVHKSLGPQGVGPKGLGPQGLGAQELGPQGLGPQRPGSTKAWVHKG